MSDSEHMTARVSSDSRLWEDFEDFREREGYESKSEAVRAAVRRGVLEQSDAGQGAEDTGLFTGGLHALGSDWYPLARDAVIVAGVALLLQSVVSGTAAAAVSAVAVAIAGVAFLGAVAGLAVRLMDAAGYRPFGDESPSAERDRA